MELLIPLAVGAVLGLVIDTLTPGRMLFGWLISALLGAAGAWLGATAFAYLDTTGVQVGGAPLFATLIGALLPVAVLQIVLAIFRRPKL